MTTSIQDGQVRVTVDIKLEDGNSEKAHHIEILGSGHLEGSKLWESLTGTQKESILTFLLQETSR